MKSKAKSEPVKTAAAKRAPKAAASKTKNATKASKTPAKSTSAATKSTAKTKTAAKPKAAPKSAAKSPAKTSAAKAAAKSPRTKAKKASAQDARGYRIGDLVIDPIGDTTDGEGHAYTGENGRDINTQPEEAEGSHAEMEAFRADTNFAASDVVLEAGPEMAAVENRARQAAKNAAAPSEEDSAQQPANLERLQKILSQAGIASRRRAEEMIAEGRVMVNGQVVTTPGSKADLQRDHIRVDGKLLHGAERHRYFVLNKPKGYVTTVSDPEGRPTVMDFVAKSRERLYPVGRLDFQSEGLLLMTNDGELANLLTKAGSGVEKTYLVKVAGQPTEQELDKLRAGVDIEREREGSGRVRTAPARVRQVREGNNPWFEVVLIEGRNRELRKMFAAVGHFVEKIRRVGYGPLTLDVEPGALRELTPDEIVALRMTAEGKIKPKRLKADRMLPKDAGVPTEERNEKRGRREFRPRTAGFGGSGERGGRPGSGGGRDGRPYSGSKPGFAKRNFDRPGFEKPRFDRPRFEKPSGEAEAGRPGGFAERPKFEGRKPFAGGKRPFGGGRPSSGPRREFGGPRGDRPQFDRPRPDKPRFDKPGFEKRSFDRPGFEKPRFDRPRFEKSSGEREADRPGGFAERPKFEGRKPFAGGKRPFGGGRPSSGPRREFGGPRGDRPQFDRPRPDKPRFDRPGFGGRQGGAPDSTREAGPRKPFRPQGDRPGGKPGAGRTKPGFGGRPGGGGKPGFGRRPGGGFRGGSGRGGGRPGGR